MVQRRIKFGAVLVGAILLGSSVYLLLDSTHSSPATRFSASFSDMQGFGFVTQGTFEAKVLASDFSLLPVGLGQDKISVRLSPLNPSTTTNLTILDVYTGKTYYSTSGSEIGVQVSSGAIQMESSSNANLTFMTDGGSLSGPHNQETMGFDAFNGSAYFQMALPKTFDLNLDPVANGTKFANETLTITQGNRTVAFGYTLSGVTIRLSSGAGYSGIIESPHNILIFGNDVSEFTYIPKSWVLFNEGPNLAGKLEIQYPFGRMNVSTGEHTFLGVENVQLNGTISDLQLSNGSDRYRMTVDGSATFVKVDGTDITKVSPVQAIQASAVVIAIGLSVISIVVSTLGVIMNRRRR